MLHGINISLLEKRYKFFMRTMVSCITAIVKVNPQAATLLTDLGTISEQCNALIEFIKENGKA